MGVDLVNSVMTMPLLRLEWLRTSAWHSGCVTVCMAMYVVLLGMVHHGFLQQAGLHHLCQRIHVRSYSALSGRLSDASLLPDAWTT